MEVDTGATGSLLTQGEYQDGGGRDGGADMSSSKDKMMAAAAGEEEEVDELLAAISASGGAIRSLPRKLDSLLSEPEYGLQQAEKDEIGRLKHDLEELIGSYLIEPSEVQAPALTAERWVKEVRELSYDIDDFVDELFHDGANARISFARKTSRVKIAPLQKKTSPRGWITAEITGFRTRVKVVIQRHIRYHLDKRTMRPKWGVPDEGQLPLLHLHGVEAVHGLMEELESRLLTDDGDGEQHKLKVVSITGFGGVGKTTLANQLYSRLRGRFQCRAFVRTSRKPDMRRLLTNMLSQLRRHQPIDAWEVPDLINNIRTHLQDKKYFIIIDDLWTLSTWDIVSRALPDSNRCGRVLITTEIDIVAQACCGYKSSNIITMKPLSYTESTELFLSIAFGHEHECSGQLDEVSCAIIRKCGGLPLAIITIACLLASQRDKNMKQYLSYIQNSMNFNLWTNPTLEGMKQVLSLSYNNLPQRLKACMLYLSIYQEDYILSKDDLVKQWIAEGFISEVEGKDMEEVAERYLNELINKGMIQPVDINYNGDVLSCTVHYMVLNLIRYKSIEENFIITIDHSQTAIRLADKVRRLSLHFGNEKDATPPANMRLSQVRSLAFSGFLKCMPSITEFKLLRVLILKLWVDHDDTSYNLNEISKLFRLRYLYIDACHLSLELPTEMQLLKDLVTLKIDAKVSEVPFDIVHLHGLFHLHLPGETNLPDSIGHMTSLRTLAYYNLSSNSEHNVLHLDKLTNLRDLCLTCSTVLPNNLESNMQHLCSILGKLSNLKSLTLNTLDDVGVTCMSISCDGLSRMSVPPAVLERLEFSRRICTFSSLPSWIGKLNKLCILKISVRELLRNDIDILKGLPALTALSLYALVSASRRIVFDGAGFRILKYFKFVCTAPCLAFFKGAMPNVRKLKLGFNADRMEQYNPKRAGFEHLTGLKEISAKIGGACADAESVFITAVSKHASNPRIIVQLVDWKFYDDEDRSMSRREQEHLTTEEQDEILEKQDEDPREEKKQDDSRERERDQSSMEITTGAMSPLLLKLGELLKDEYNMEKRVRKRVMSLETELTMMHAALRKVAEVPPDQLDEPVRIWARKVRELSYDMEDTVDAFMVRVEEGRDCEPAGTNLKNRVKMFLKKTTGLFTKGKDLHPIAAAMEEAQDLAKQLADLRQRYELKTHNTSAGATIDPRLKAMFKDVEELVGIDSTRDELIKMLTEGDDASKQRLRTVSIVGFGGLGKTTLANVVYQKLKAQFDCAAFVSLCQNPDAKKILKDMLYQFDKQKYENIHNASTDETRLIHDIRKFLQSKRYLIIIDDIWDEKLWRDIKCAFSNRNNLGSRLITTTRKVSVSKACCSSSDDIVYKMEPLSDNDSQRLFYQRIFPDRSGCPSELEQVSRDILKKCGGVPLAIITIASLLASKKQTKDEWYTLLNSIGRGLMGPTCVQDMQRILSFSYYDLPSKLKTCLLYISVFPEDNVIDRDQLIWMWIAEGFIQCEKQQTSLFELGESYFNELINRSMIQPLESYFDKEGRGKECRVHDMVLDLIRALSREENFVTILDGSTPNLQSKVRRLSLQNSEVGETTPPDSVSQVRSITIYPPAINLMPPLSSFRVLRVLNLRKCDLGESINLRDVGNLFHLRYLGLASTGICELPEEIGKLQFLQVLDVRSNQGLSVLPSTVVKLRRLMCLDVDGIRLPDGMGNLTSMEVLHIIFACPNIVKELRNLTRLREFTIFFPPDGPNLEEAFVESLRSLQNIQRLALVCSFGSMDLFGERWVPPPCLRSFHLVMKGFSTMPAWVKRYHSRLSNLSDLLITVKELRQEDLQTLGMLPALCSLQIKITHQKQRLRLVVADWFQYVIFFKVECEPAGHIMFQQGALPRAQEVDFPFDVRMAKDDGNDDFDVGLGNLLSLQKVGVTIFRDGDTVGEAKEAEAALRHATDAHPNHPTIKIDFKPFLLESDDDGIDSFICHGEEFTALDGDFSFRRRRRRGRAGARRGRAGATSVSDGDKDENEDGPEKSS